MNTGIEVIVYISYAGIIVFIFLLANFLAFSAKTIGKIVLGTAGGCIVMLALNLLGENVGIYIPINPFTALCAGILGIPGIILMCVLI